MGFPDEDTWSRGLWVSTGGEQAVVEEGGFHGEDSRLSRGGSVGEQTALLSSVACVLDMERGGATTSLGAPFRVHLQSPTEHKREMTGRQSVWGKGLREDPMQAQMRPSESTLECFQVKVYLGYGERYAEFHLVSWK
ncbi:unnamed protein product [Linum trigynum]|uniref:Uncharacterized protein n=1 Tax=Linum trigynum TaxID=586398 RepID=A0AAV2CWN5_9ROSI